MTSELPIQTVQLLEIAQQELARGLENASNETDNVNVKTGVSGNGSTHTKTPSIPVRRRGRRSSSSSRNDGFSNGSSIGSGGLATAPPAASNGSTSAQFQPGYDDSYEHNTSPDDTIDDSIHLEDEAEYEEEDTEVMEDVEMQLTSLNITSIPIELIDLIKDKVTKLSLQDNWIVSLPLQFHQMSQLSYLDISHNRLTEFPSILCQCPRIEILDISGNLIKSLPSTIGNLAESLKVLSLSNNQFKYLPPCISDMVDLQFLEIDNNPLVLPPKDIVDAKNQLIPDEWISNVKKYLAYNRLVIQPLIDEEYDDLQEAAVKSNSHVHIEQLDVVPLDIVPLDVVPLISPDHQQFQQTSSSNLDSNITHTTITTAYPSPSSPNHDYSTNIPTTMNTVTTPITANSSSPTLSSSSWSSERIRSNSESQVSSRAAKRMGFIIKKRTSPAGPQLSPISSITDTPRQLQPLSVNNAITTGAVTPAVTPVTTSISVNSIVTSPVNSTNEMYLNEPNHIRAQSHDSVFELVRSLPTASPSAPPIIANGQPIASATGSTTGAITSTGNNTMSGNRSRAGSTSAGPSLSTSPVLGDSAPGAYFRRLSTLPEEMRIPVVNDDVHNQIMEVARKVLFSSHEFHDIVRRCSAFCTDKQLAFKLNTLLQNVQTTFPDLVSALEVNDNNPEDEFAEYNDASVVKLKQSVVKCSDSIQELCQFFRANIDKLVTFIDVKFVRTMIMITFASFNELYNAWQLLNNPASSQHLNMPSAASNESSNTADDQLYDRIYFAANAAQTVLGQLTEAISKSAAASVQGQGLGITPAVAAKVKDLANTCVPGVDVTRRLKQRMDIMKETGQLDRKKFWDDTNAFLKAIIAILASTKTAMTDLLFLNDARQSLSTLARVAKEIPVLLEYSSYRVLLMNDQSTNSNSMISPMSNNPSSTSVNNTSTAMTSTISPPPSTPLVAVLGPAAQAVMSPSYQSAGYASSPFVPPGV